MKNPWDVLRGQELPVVVFCVLIGHPPHLGILPLPFPMQCGAGRHRSNADTVLSPAESEKTIHIEPYTPPTPTPSRSSRWRVVAVFDSLKEALAPAVWEQFYPDGWRTSQEKSVRDACASADFKTWVAIEGGAVAGFVAVRFHEGKLGEIYMIAVDPDYQRRGIAMALTDFAVDRMKDAGMEIAMVETGGDWGHAPARAAYEKRDSACCRSHAISKNSRGLRQCNSIDGR